MEDTVWMDRVHTAHVAFRQRFQALAIQLRAIHTDWQEAVRVDDHARQSALITREGEVLADVQKMITAYLALIAQRPE
jgi:hypothetical protein